MNKRWPFSPLNNEQNEQLAAGWAPFQLKNGTLSSRFSPCFLLGKGSAIWSETLSRYLPIFIQICRRRWRLQKKARSNGWIITGENTNPKETYRKQNMVLGQFLLLINESFLLFGMTLKQRCNLKMSVAGFSQWVMGSPTAFRSWLL